MLEQQDAGVPAIAAEDHAARAPCAFHRFPGTPTLTLHLGDNSHDTKLESWRIEELKKQDWNCS